MLDFKKRKEKLIYNLSIFKRIVWFLLVFEEDHIFYKNDDKKEYFFSEFPWTEGFPGLDASIPWQITSNALEQQFLQGKNELK